MNIQSIKTRLTGSYVILLALIVLQLPIIYFLVGGMSEKYGQVDLAGTLRKRAVEITEVLNRHITTGNESLEEVFQTEKTEYAAVLDEFRRGSSRIAPVTGGATLEKLSMVETKWEELSTLLDRGMEAGDRFRERKLGAEGSTMRMLSALDALSVQLEEEAGLKGTVSGLKVSALRQAYLLERYFLAHDLRSEVGTRFNEAANEFDTMLDSLRAAGLGEGAGAALREVEGLWSETRAEATGAVESYDAYQNRLGALVEVHTPELAALAGEFTTEIVEEARSSAARAILVLALSVLFSAAVAGSAMWTTGRHIIAPILRIKKTVEEIAGGNLASRSGVRLGFFGREIKDEIISLGESVDHMGERMSSVIGSITESSNHLASASEELSLSAAHISDGANRQSAQTSQTATAMEEMSATVIEVAKNSQQASDSANEASQIATEGGNVVTEAISAMREVAESTAVTAETVKKLGASSEEIGTIVSVINDIADQTNLLALNAAIEAARAGEQGRGFAVVADEVRKLAERTTKATKEISGMIQSIQTETSRAVDGMDQGAQKVENGVRLANEAGEALRSIVSSVESVSDMIGHIATSSEEQSATTEEITQNVDAIAEVARSNVSAMSEVSGASGELARLASELKELVSSFRLEDRTRQLKVVSTNKTLHRPEAGQSAINSRQTAP